MKNVNSLVKRLSKKRLSKQYVPLPFGLKEKLLHTLPGLQSYWGVMRGKLQHYEYNFWREYYADQVQQQQLVYHKDEIISAIRLRLAQRGYTPPTRQIGDIHTFAFVPDIGWHRHLLPDLSELGPVTVFDYVSYGYSWDEFHKADNAAIKRRLEMNQLVLPALQKAHEIKPVDWVFAYANGMEISAQTIKQITEEFGIPTVNMCLDDKQSWVGPQMGDHRGGQIDIASAFDLSWTSARIACEWYMVEGGRPIYMPEGFDMHGYFPLPVTKDIPVSFIGQAYGFRKSVVHYLQRHKVPIQAFGKGWATSGWVKNINEIVNRSVINLGMGGILYSESLTNVKGRDFEIPGTGGGVYLTTFNPDLAQHFVIGEEILCYRNRDELLELIRYYLKHPDETQAIAQRGRERCLREHRWLHRYQNVCQILGIL